MHRGTSIRGRSLRENKSGQNAFSFANSIAAVFQSRVYLPLPLRRMPLRLASRWFIQSCFTMRTRTEIQADARQL